MFQSTHPHGVRLRRNHPRTISTKFQSTHPHGVRRRAATPTFYDIRGFNPRTHTGCDIPSPSAATRRSCFNPRTHTGCDCHTWSLIRRSLTFQSTHPHGVRHARFVLNFERENIRVSIHAPTRGATRDAIDIIT